MHFIENDVRDPAWNLALEETLLESMDEFPGAEEIGMLWINPPSVIIGRYQNALEQFDAGFAEQNGIQMVRRMTGGGAVYHDEGNLNFSFFLRDAGAGNALDFGRFTARIVRALEGLGLRAQIDGRNDIALQGLKVSGNAQTHRKGRVLHHGTLLFSVDLDRMARVLTPPDAKIESRGIASVRGRVTNLSEHLPGAMSMADFRAHLRAAVFPGAIPLKLGEDFLSGVRRLSESKYKNWDWNYGASPAFSLVREARLPMGSIRFSLAIEEGRIRLCKIHGDFFGDGDLSPLEEGLKGVVFRAGPVREALEKAGVSRRLSGITVPEIQGVIFPESV